MNSVPKKVRGRPGRGWRLKFLKALTDRPVVTFACHKARVDPKTAYEAKRKDAQFRQAWERALSLGVQNLEAECWRRAKDGTRKGVWQRNADGNPVKVETVREFSDTLAIFMLKAHAPEKYRELSKIEHVGAGGGPIVTKNETPLQLTPERLRELLSWAEVQGIKPATLITEAVELLKQGQHGNGDGQAHSPLPPSANPDGGGVGLDKGQGKQNAS